MVIGSWGMHLDENNKSGTILSFDSVCAGSPVWYKKVNKQVQGI